MSSTNQRLKGILSVTVLKAQNLIKSDWIGDNDCYTVLSLEALEVEGKVKVGKRKEQTETYQRTQTHDGCHPIFNEKVIFPISGDLNTLFIQIWDSDPDKDDLLGHGTVNLIDDDHGGEYDTNTNKEWLHIVTVPLEKLNGGNGGSLDLVLHFIPESVAEYLSKRFDARQAELKKKLTQEIVSKMTDVAADQIRGSVGIGV